MLVPIKPCPSAKSGWHVFRPKPGARDSGYRDDEARCLLCGQAKVLLYTGHWSERKEG
jgi:hypothetical protein